MTTTTSTLRQRQLGKRLRELRKTSGLSIAEVADQLLCSQAKISRMETASRSASPRDVRDLCAIYGLTDQDEVSKLMALASASRHDEWWSEYDDVEFRPLIGLEQEAVGITEYETTTIPGLIQTEEYARAVIRGFLPLIDADVLEDRVQARVKRQELLERSDPPRYWVLLDESVLHREVGGREVMHEQLKRLAEVADKPHVTIQVIPFSVGAHMGFDNAFMYLQFDKLSGVPDTVFVEHLLGHFFLDADKHSKKVERFDETRKQLVAVAISPDESKKRIMEMSKRMAERR